MKLTKYPASKFLLFFFLTTFVSHVFAQEYKLAQSHANGIYATGETIEVTLIPLNVSSDSIELKIDRNFNNKASWQKMPAPQKPIILFEGKFDEATAMVFRLRLPDGEIKATGFVVAPGELQPSTERPADFDAFWKHERAALRALPMNVKLSLVENVPQGYECSDIELNCTGQKPARGYFAKPAKAEKGSLPIVLFVHAAGVNGDWCLSKPETALGFAQKGKGALCFDLNAHGMLNGQPQKYYDDLYEGELKNYWTFGAENREENYFLGMYLRLQQTLDFLCAQPEWDGKRILVIGESQGGGQALAAAGLDSRVSAVVATVPAMCDFGRSLIGETGGWPNPFTFDGNREKMLHTYPYFDTAHLLKDSKATLVVEIGLIDYTCPPSGIYAALNQVRGQKIILPVPYRGHHVDQKEFQKEWEKTVYKTKQDFIGNFLK